MISREQEEAEGGADGKERGFGGKGEENFRGKAGLGAQESGPALHPPPGPLPFIFPQRAGPFPDTLSAGQHTRSRSKLMEKIMVGIIFK